MTASKRRGRLALIAFGVPLVLAVGLAVGLGTASDPLAALATRRMLASQPGVRGEFERATFSPLHLSYRLVDLKLWEEHDRGHPPFLFVDDVQVRFRWKDLLRFRFVANAEVEHAKVSIVLDTKDEIRRIVQGIEDGALMKSLRRRLLLLPPAVIERLEVRDGEVLVVDRTETEVPVKSAEVWVHGAEVRLEGLATRPGLDDSKPIALWATGTLQQSGKLEGHLTVDLFSKAQSLSVKGSVRELALRELYGFLAEPSGLQATRGTVDGFVELAVKEGTVQGQLRLTLNHLELAPAKASLGNDLKAIAANAVVNASSSKPVEVVIPITGGHAADPKAAMQEAVMAAIRDAYLAPAKLGVASH